MDNAFQILVVILSSFLGIMLLMSIVTLYFIIKIVRSVRRITESAENMVDKAEAFSEFVAYASTPMHIAKLFAEIAGKVFNGTNQSRRNRRGKSE